MRFLSFICALVLLAASFSWAAEKPKEEKYLTKGEAIAMISTTDFMKRKIGELLSWSIGYDLSAVAQIKLVPTFNYIVAQPRKVPPDGRTVFDVRASVEDPGGLTNIAGVRADMSSIGKLSNMSLVDNGLFGDEKPGDGVYTLQISVSPKVVEGDKEISVAAVNKKGWLALGRTSLIIKKDPAILEVKTNPFPLPADGKTPILLTVKIDNPGRIEDVERVAADLSAFGYGDKLILRNDGAEGDVQAEDDVFSGIFTLSSDLAPGRYGVSIEAVNEVEGRARLEIELTVIK